MLIAMTAAGTPPDVLWVNNDQVAQFASQDLVQALESFINRDKRDLGAYYPFGLRVYQFQGKQVCIPESLNPMGIFINRTLFEQAGVPLPTRSFRDSAWTADDLLEAAKKLTRSTQAGKQFGFMVDNWIGRWFPFLWGNGGDAFDDANNPKRFTFVSPQTEQTLQWLVDLKTRHQVSPQPAELQGTSMATLFAEGRLAMRLDGIWVMPELDQVEGLKWDVVPVTRGPAGRFTRMAGAGLGLHPGSKNKETAWAFVKFLSGPEAPPLTRDITVKIPPVKAAAESARFMDWLPAETKKLWLEAHEYSKIQAHHLKWQDVMEGDGARKFYTEALNGERPVKDALEQVKTHAQAHLQRPATRGPLREPGRRTMQAVTRPRVGRSEGRHDHDDSRAAG
jgi:multiple sugar transport system substrate-binding protein